MNWSQQKNLDLQNELFQASISAIEITMPQLEKYWKSKVWLERNNSLRKNAIDFVNKFSNSNSPKRHSFLRTYIAASVFIHAFDGWSYLGRAIEAEIAGDSGTARHLGYYAELRAAMSFLASNGIGVFQWKHVVVDKLGHCNIAENFGGTHEFTWHALNEQASKPAGISSILSVIKPFGVSLDDWTTQFNSSTKYLATSWLKQWGFDLKMFDSDRTARNQASYRPSSLTFKNTAQAHDSLKVILQFWEMCSPDVKGGFQGLDLNLLRFLLSDINRQTMGSRKQNYDSILENTIDKVGLGSQSKQLLPLLSIDTLANTHEIIDLATMRSDWKHRNHSLHVLARATLLLRVATGCSARLLGFTNSDPKSSLSFWWSDRSVRRSLWPPDTPPDLFTDLWFDIDYAVNEIEPWLNANGDRASRYELRKQFAKSVALLTTTERVYLWGIGL